MFEQRQGHEPGPQAALTNQKIVAGLGNIYACEALHRARISPRRRSGTIASRVGTPNDRARVLVDAIKSVLNDAILLAWQLRNRTNYQGFRLPAKGLFPRKMVPG